MSISISQWLPPSSSLPNIRSLHTVTESQLRTALDNLQTIYCPLRLPTQPVKAKGAILRATVDSGYVSEDEAAEEAPRDVIESLSIYRLDDFERSFVVRWLTNIVSRVEELSFGEDVVSDIVNKASFIISSFSDSCCDGSDDTLIRDFSFPIALSQVSVDRINVRLKEAPLSGTDHMDTGLQSWGAGIIFSGLLCAQPQRFRLTSLPPDAKVVELGAGTGLISLTLARLLPLLPVVSPTIVATDYHSEVLVNLRANVAMSCPPATPDAILVKTSQLDWATPPAALKSSVHLLLAADVVYAYEHAAWLRDCAAHLLTLDGVFWLVVTLRTSGKFETIPSTVEAVFRDGNCPRTADGRILGILEKEILQKKRGVGRGDESGYMLFKIGWTAV